MTLLLKTAVRALRDVAKISNASIRTITGAGADVSEEEKARSAARAQLQSRSEPTIFDKIISKELPADIFYEDDRCVAFNDVSPQAPIHFLVIPKTRILKLEDAVPTDGELLGHLMTTAGKLGKDRAPEGFRIVVNNGMHGCQSVYHLHIHVLGGRQLKWPPG